MAVPVNILLADDSANDAELIIAALAESGFNPTWRRVQTEAEFVKELQNQPDIILSDYSMPDFDGLRAAELLQASGLKIPFILISGTVGEEVAVEAMKRGATDYLLKDRIARLGLAVQRALKETREHIENETGRKRTEDVLKESERRFREMLENVSLIAITLDKCGVVTFCNDYLLQLTGWHRSEVMGADWCSMFLPPLNPARAVFFDNIDAGKIPLHYENPIRTKRGGLRDIVWNNTMLRDAIGNVVGTASLGEDVTERRQLEEQFRHAQKMEGIGQLASGVAHDFNNILAVIQLQAGLLKSETTLSAGQLNHAREIEEATQRAANLTRQLLLFSRKQVMQTRDLDLNEIVTNITKMLRRILGEDIQILLKFSPRPLSIHADPGMVDQVILNLAVNARDAMPKGGHLIIETSAVDFDEAITRHAPQAQAGSFVCLKMTDAGCGIPPEILTRIFEPFFTTKEVGKGTGLGLATVYGIIQQHRGWVEVQSKEGEGTTFLVYLPRLTTIPDKRAEWASLASVIGGNETILLVEDDGHVRTATRTALARLGYRMLEAVNGVEALKIGQQHGGEIRLLLTDLMMPGGVNGKDLAEKLLKQNPGLKVIYISGYSADIAGKNFHLKEGINFLAKPFEAHKLAQTIRNCLDGPEK